MEGGFESEADMVGTKPIVVLVTSVVRECWSSGRATRCGSKIAPPVKLRRGTATLERQAVALNMGKERESGPHQGTAQYGPKSWLHAHVGVHGAASLKSWRSWQ